jgi:Cu-Zn family superoxide dismutase
MKRSVIGIVLGFALSSAHAESLSVTVHTVSPQGVGSSIGTISFEDTAKGLKVSPQLSGISAGDHGFHIHENPDCSPKEKDGAMVAALAAGPHYDPHKTGKHMGPHGGGHKGDLPKLVASADGRVAGSFVVDGVSLADIRGRSVMIHAGGDNYSDEPAPLGGGGARIGCGVIAAK